LPRTHEPRRGSCLAIKLFAQDIGVSGVPTGLGEHMNQDVEQLHVRAWPPRHVASGADVEGVDR